MSKKPVTQMVRWVQNANQTIKRNLSAGNTTSMYGSSAATYGGGGGGSKQWVHPPEVLQFGRVEYTVKYLGEVEVSQPKGTEVIKEAIQKIRFALQIKRSAAGTAGGKLPKVELHINVDGLTIVDSKTKRMLYKYPLHRISFCADDKQDKRVFSFIAKQADSQQHNCFVFLSDKLAEEITLSIGEAFDLAYRKFVDNNGKDLETKKSIILLRRRITELEAENTDLKEQLAAYQRGQCGNLESAPDPPNLGTMPTKWEKFSEGSPPPRVPASPVPNGPPAAFIHPPTSMAPRRPSESFNGFPGTTNEAILSQIGQNGPSVGRKLENLHLDSLDDLFDDDFNPRAGEPEKSAAGGAKNGNNDHPGFGSTNPFLAASGPQENGGAAGNGGEPTEAELEDAISQIDSRLKEMREGFQRGISFGNEDFGGTDLLGDFDPLAAANNNNNNNGTMKTSVS